MKIILLILIYGSLLGAAQNSETLIRFTLLSRVREGLVFSKRTVDDIPLFAVAEFAGNEEYALSLLKKTDFDAALGNLEKAFGEADARPGCVRKIVREYVSSGKTLKKDSACLDTASSKAYEAARGYVH